MGRLYRQPYQDLERSKQRTQEGLNRAEYLRQQSLREQQIQTGTIGQCMFITVPSGRNCQVCKWPNGQAASVCN